jgi:hypothetical protein
MPIVVACPGCPTKLSAPESAAGKQVRCPKCGAAAPVPAFVPAEEVPVVDATPVPPKRKPARAEDDEDERPVKAKRRDDDDDDEEEDRPRKKKRRAYEDDAPRRTKRRKAGGGAGLLVGLIAVGFVVVGGLALGVYLLAGKKGEEEPLASKTPPPEGWEQHSYPDAGIKAYMPARPDHMSVPVDALGRGGFGRRRDGFQAADIRDMESFSIFNSRGVDGTHVELVVLKFRNRVPASVRDQILEQPNLQVGRGQSKTVRWLGRDATEQTGTHGMARVVFTDRHAIVAAIAGPHGSRARPEEEAGFFDNFELTR